MRVSIHQPQYLPWYPYIQKIITSDLFIFLDTVDFQKNGLQNRNKILTNNGPAWLTVPIKHKLGQKIIETKISNESNWIQKHMKTLTLNYGKLDFFAKHHDDLWNIYHESGDSLAELNIALTKKILQWMNVSTPILRSSQLSASGSASELILNICREVGATTYVSGIGGKNYLDQALFETSDIFIEFLSPILPKPYIHFYPKLGSHPDLSVIDFLFNCGNSWQRYQP